jgi:hypothetical protein
MWAAIAILFVLALVVISFAAGGAWLIIAVPLAILVLAPVVLRRLRQRTAAGPDLSEAREHARPAVQDASKDDLSPAPPPDVP